MSRLKTGYFETFLRLWGPAAVLPCLGLGPGVVRPGVRAHEVVVGLMDSEMGGLHLKGLLLRLVVDYLFLEMAEELGG